MAVDTIDHLSPNADNPIGHRLDTIEKGGDRRTAYNQVVLETGLFPHDPFQKLINGAKM